MNNYKVVSMANVPLPTKGAKISKYEHYFQEVRKLGFTQDKALCVETKGANEVNNIRTSLRRRAKKDKLFLCTSHDDAYKSLYMWLIRQENVK